jgi:creatinine amidohydrolase
MTRGLPLKGIVLEELTWVEAEQLLTPAAVVVIPLGAAAKEHGPHLPLKTDWVLAEYFKRRVREALEVVIAPTVGYHFYPAFVDYPGSTSLRCETARDTIIDICRSLARHGPRRFYVLNTGISTLQALQPAAATLAAEGLLLRATDLRTLSGPVVQRVARQAGGSHADEIETSMMLYIAPELVEMSKAATDYHPGVGALTRDLGGPGVYSPTGIYGDATLARRETGEQVVEAIVAGLIKDIEELRQTPLPLGTGGRYVRATS